MIQDTFKNRWIECLTTRGIINTKKLKNNQAKTYQCPNILIRFQIQYSKTLNFETESIPVRGFEIQKLRSPKKDNFSLMNHGIESVSICEHLSVHHYVLYTVLIIKYRKENVSTKNLVGNLSFHHIFPLYNYNFFPKNFVYRMFRKNRYGSLTFIHSYMSEPHSYTALTSSNHNQSTKLGRNWKDRMSDQKKKRLHQKMPKISSSTRPQYCNE